MKKLLASLYILALFSCNMAPNRQATVRITTICGTYDTLTIEYRTRLYLASGELRDNIGYAHVTGVRSYSIIGQVKNIK